MNGDSTVIALLRAVRKHTNETEGHHSWRELNASLSGALHLAIKSKFKFERDDFKEISESFRPEYWLDIERAYFHAAGGNRTAAISIEKHVKRKPFFFVAHKEKERLAVSSQFYFDKEHRVVTSIAGNGDSLIACTYHDRKRDENHYLIGTEKVKTRLTLTRAQLLEGKA